MPASSRPFNVLVWARSRADQFKNLIPVAVYAASAAPAQMAIEPVRANCGVGRAAQKKPLVAKVVELVNDPGEQLSSYSFVLVRSLKRQDYDFTS